MSDQSLSSIAGNVLLAVANPAARDAQPPTVQAPAGGVESPAQLAENRTTAFAGMLDALRPAASAARPAGSGTPESLLRIPPTRSVPFDGRMALALTDVQYPAGKPLPAPGNGVVDPGTPLPVEDLLAVLPEPQAAAGIPDQAPLDHETAPTGLPSSAAESPIIPLPAIVLPPTADTPETIRATLPGPGPAPTLPAATTLAASAQSGADTPALTSAPAAAADLEDQTPDGNDGGEHRSRERGGDGAQPRTAVDGASRGPGIAFDRIDSPSTLTLHTTAPAPGSTTADALRPLELPGNRTHWPEPLAERLAALIGRHGTTGVNTADIRLNPPHLGQLDVRIVLQHDHATVWVASANPDVRDALQQALPRLDALLDTQGIRLADAQVSDRSFQGFLREGGSADRLADEHPEADPTTPATGSTRGPIGLLDAWA